ncbi:CD80-like c2-set immunoglobulin domain-containing protein [Phthorimaea operculella]|nr:CD80-like c2-set immunoglobulin domain-containing protein [Phthorimaea operculella]
MVDITSAQLQTGSRESEEVSLECQASNKGNVELKGDRVSKLEVRESEEVSLECQARNAKPPAKLVWYKGNVELKGERVSKLEVRESEEVSLECQARNAKPPAKLVWYKGNVELKGDRVSREEVRDVESANGNPKGTRYTTISRVTFKATADDDYADFTCEARHEALSRDHPMRSTVQLSVLYPPGAPYIEGYAEGETVRRGQSLELVCRSRGGNPPAQLIWYKNGEQIRMAYRYDTCAFHSGYAEGETVRRGQSLELVCRSRGGNPPAQLIWYKNGEQIRMAYRYDT